MDVNKLQLKLDAAGYKFGALDGDFGPKTITALLNYTVGKDIGSLSVMLGRALAIYFKRYDITTSLRILHFVAQAAHETGGFRHLNELGSGDKNGDGYDDYLQKYDFRADLGNSKLGDGDRYRGHGIFQITGKYNHGVYGKKIGIDLVTNPKKASEPDIAAQLACLYWNEKKLNALADADDIRGITKKINGGYNGLADRQKYVTRLKAVF